MGVPIHPTEFRTDGGFEPVHGADLFFSLPPLLLAGLALAFLAAFLFGWMLGQGRRGPSDHDGAAIWKAIDEAIQTAMKAHSDVLFDRAGALKRTIEARLGETLTLAGGLKACKALTDALDEGHADDHDAHDHPSDDSGEDEAHDTGAAGVRIGHAGSVVIHTTDGGRGRRPDPDHTRGRHDDHPPTPAQRREAVRRAVSDLNDHWRHKDARIREIAAAHRELSAKRSAGKDGGWRFS